jgi:hypothetical protein
MFVQDDREEEGGGEGCEVKGRKKKRERNSR